MHTPARNCAVGGLTYGDPLDREPPGQRPPDRDPPTEPPLDIPPWTEISLDRDLPCEQNHRQV